VIDVNLLGVFTDYRVTLPELIKTKGSFVNIPSVMGLVAGARVVAYTSSKFGLVGLNKGMTLDYAKDGVRVNAICPGFVNTPLVQRSRSMAGTRPLRSDNRGSAFGAGTTK